MWVISHPRRYCCVICTVFSNGVLLRLTCGRSAICRSEIVCTVLVHFHSRVLSHSRSSRQRPFHCVPHPPSYLIVVDFRVIIATLETIRLVCLVNPCYKSKMHFFMLCHPKTIPCLSHSSHTTPLPRSCWLGWQLHNTCKRRESFSDFQLPNGLRK